MPSRLRWLCSATIVMACGLAASVFAQEERPRARRPRGTVAARPEPQAEAAAQAGDEDQRSAATERPQQGPQEREDDAPRQVRGPFEPLTPAQEKALDRVLADWQARGARVEKFMAEFTRWEYNQAFGKRGEDGRLLPSQQSEGFVRYFAPDQGEYKITEPEGAEHWVCDGKSIFYYDAAQMKLVETPLPPNLQGQRIIDGPLPFLFGADAARHKQRYWLRLVTPKEERDAGRIWIQAFPRFQADFANWHQATMILTAEDMLPHAIETVLPNGDWTVHQFTDVTINSIWHRFKRPKLPAGWTHERQEPQPDVEVPEDAERQSRPLDDPPRRRAARPRREE